MRKLVTIRKVADIIPIKFMEEGKEVEASNIELAKIDGWDVIVNKGLKKDDLVVYFEIDSYLPIEPRYEFLRKSSYKRISAEKEGFRLRTMKMKGVISQGLALPLSEFAELKKAKLGADVTDKLNIEKYEEPDEPYQPPAKSNRNWWQNLLYKWRPLRNFIFRRKWLAEIIFPTGQKSTFPSFVPKTDEERIQNLGGHFRVYKNELYEESEKLDGCLDENTLIETENDGQKTIKEICDTKYFKKIKAFDIISNNVVFKKIIGHSIRDNIDNWYLIELDNGKTLKVTADHKIWLPELNCYRDVKDLKECDIVWLD
ncbi:MAG: hypothetical protein WC783_03395 [Candidatus Paceibacterota bacterium]|jgi:hypothetical protein